MFHVGEALRKFWTRQGVRLRPGASEEEMAAFEARYGVRLPSDLREYFAAADGFDGSTDDETITFLGLDEVKPLGEYWSPEVEGGNSYFVFADFLISSHVYAVRLARDAGAGNPVAVVYDRELVEAAGSFSEFVAGYLESSHAVLFPG